MSGGESWREDVPGTFSPGFEPPPLYARKIPDATRVLAVQNGWRHLMAWRLGECQVVQFQERGADHQWAYRFTVSHASRLPSWDEIKLARYRLLPAGLTFAL